MSRQVAESPKKYLNSRLGIVNEALKKAYISGKRIMVLVTNEFDFVTELISRESLLPIEYGKEETFFNKETKKSTSTFKGYNTVAYVDESSSFIEYDAKNINCCKPTLYLCSNGFIPYSSLVNYVRHFYGMSCFRDPNELKWIETLRQSVIMLVVPNDPRLTDKDDKEKKGKVIPQECEPLTEYINVPYLSEDEFNEILSVWLNKHEGLPLSVGNNGFVRIDDTHYLKRLFQIMRALSPCQITSCLAQCKLEFGELYHQNEDDPRLSQIIKKIRSVSDSVISHAGALSLIDSSKAAQPDGLSEIINWLNDNTNRISNPQDYERFQMTPPKGLLISGIPGSGKSMLAKYISAKLKLSLVRLDLGDALGKFVGESEKGFKTALEVAESLSPCVLWIDEMEKMFEGGHEVTRRLIGKFLTWMQEKTERGVSCFVYATANDISKMPPEMFRTGRFDKKFYTFMPSADDCAEIFESIIRHQNNVYESKQPDLSDIKPLFNIKLINKDAFIKILNSTICLKTKVNKSWDDVIPRNNKFFIGSDIEQLIISAKAIYLNEYKGADSKDAIFDSELFLGCLKRAILNMKTYGETNLEKIAIAFSDIAKNNFAPASKNDLMPINGYNEPRYKQAVRKDRSTTVQLYSLQDEDIHIHSLKNEYDKQLYMIVSKILNSISLDIIEKRV